MKPCARVGGTKPGPRRRVAAGAVGGRVGAGVGRVGRQLAQVAAGVHTSFLSCGEPGHGDHLSFFLSAAGWAASSPRKWARR